MTMPHYWKITATALLWLEVGMVAAKEGVSSITQTPPSYNCEPLSDDFQVRWKVAEGSDVIDFELIARIPDNAYMAFGVSGNPLASQMVGGDPVVADFSDGSPRVRDFHMDDKKPCFPNDETTGVCPDDTVDFVNDIDQASVSGVQQQGLSLVRYQRPSSPSDAVDLAINTAAGVSTTFIWAMGSVNQGTGNPGFHGIDWSKEEYGLFRYEIGRPVEDNCAPLIVEEPPPDDEEEEEEEEEEGELEPIAPTPASFNCEPLSDDFQVRWKVVEGSDVIDFELIARIPDNAYMAFGVSGNPLASQMVGGDPVVADFSDGSPRVRDFHMDDKKPCFPNDETTGVCPDDTVDFVNDIDQASVSGVQQQGLSLVRYQRPSSPSDAVDLAINTAAGVSTTFIWAMGSVNQDTGNPGFHGIDWSKEEYGLFQYEIGRPVEDNCAPLIVEEPPPDEDEDDDDDDEEEIVPFFRHVFTGVTEFRANIGPSGGERGYESMTGGRPASPEGAWYLNGKEEKSREEIVFLGYFTAKDSLVLYGS